MVSKPHASTPGPFRADQLKSGDRYELADGHAYYCAPTGGAGASRQGLANQIIASDPAVEDAGIDAGFSPDGKTLWAPDVSVGVSPDVPGWIKGVPPLAIEYAGVGQDEPLLQSKIADLSSRGTRFIWVIRLVGPHRIEIYEAGQPMRMAGPGDVLSAPGVLANAVPFEAFYDAETARALTFRNLLQRFGYASIDAVREEGHLEGKLEGHLEGQLDGKAELLRSQLEHRFGPLDVAAMAVLSAATEADLNTWALALFEARTLDEVFAMQRSV